jgi:hypothetical protein
VTAVSAVALAISLAAAAGFGGFLLSKAIENEALAEVKRVGKPIFKCFPGFLSGVTKNTHTHTHDMLAQ